jgi:hypothetical protein
MRPYRSVLPAIATNWGAGGPQSINRVLGIGWKGTRMTASPRSMPLAALCAVITNFTKWANKRRATRANPKIDHAAARFSFGD